MQRKTEGQKPTEDRPNNINARQSVASQKLAANLEYAISAPKSAISATGRIDVSALRIRADLPIPVPEHLHGLVEVYNQRIQDYLSCARKECYRWLPDDETQRLLRHERNMERRREFAALEASEANNQGGAQQ